MQNNTLQQNPSEIVGKPGNRLVLCMAFRQSLIIALGAIEDYLGMERSVVPRRKVR